MFTRWLMPCVTVCPFADIGVLRGLKNAMEDSRASFFKSLGSPPEDHPLKEMLPRFTKVCPPPPPSPRLLSGGGGTTQFIRPRVTHGEGGIGTPTVTELWCIFVHAALVRP